MRITREGGGAATHKFFAAGINAAAKPCDYCKSAVALLFCRADSAFMCIGCDAKVHNANVKHERVWMCEVCEHAPGAFTCKADAAALCVTCDRDIHSANQLASRQDRVPVVPFYDTAESVAIKSTAAAATLNFPVDEYEANFVRRFDDNIAQNGYVPSDSWTPPSPIVAAQLSADTSDLDTYQIPSRPCSDSVVPVKPPVPARLTQDHSPDNRLEIEFTRSNINSYKNSNQRVSSSSLDVGIVPDGSSLSEISYPFGRKVIYGSQGSQVVGMDREASVLRYKEKRKNRKFEKTIRYASRKAYAETRPRIEGRKEN